MIHERLGVLEGVMAFDHRTGDVTGAGAQRHTLHRFHDADLVRRNLHRRTRPDAEQRGVNAVAARRNHAELRPPLATGCQERARVLERIARHTLAQHAAHPAPPGATTARASWTQSHAPRFPNTRPTAIGAPSLASTIPMEPSGSTTN